MLHEQTFLQAGMAGDRAGRELVSSAHGKLHICFGKTFAQVACNSELSDACLR
jgi:hypothetical protein